jgi:hypothetical protein
MRQTQCVFEQPTTYVCPACGQPVDPGADYVTAREYTLRDEFALHLNSQDRAEAHERRFHVGHFRGRIGELFYELADPDLHQPPQ